MNGEPDTWVVALEPTGEGPAVVLRLTDGRRVGPWSKEAVSQAGVFPGGPFDDGVEAALVAEEAFLRGKGLAMDYLSRRAASEREVERRLRQKYGLDPGVALRVVEWLRASGFLDDKGMASRLVETAMVSRSSKSRAQIRQGLKRRGIASDVASEALHQADYDEFPGALAGALRKLAALRERQARVRGTDREEGGAGRRGGERAVLREKLARWLASRGFSSDTVRRVLSELEEELGDGAEWEE